MEVIILETKDKSYSMFFISLLGTSLGITLVTKSNLGTTAIASIPYVLSLALKPSFGIFTFIVNSTFFLLQILILKKDFPKIQYLQLIVLPVLGVFIDLWMSLFGFLNPINFISKIAVSIIGCLVLAISISLQLKANVVINPAEGIVNTLAYKAKTEFGKIKSYFDIFLIVIAAILSFILMGKIKGIGLSTLITAGLVGFLVRLIARIEKKVFNMPN